MLFADRERDYQSAVEELAKAGVHSMTLVSSRDDPAGAQSSQWIESTCIRIVARTSIPERLVDFDRATCDAPATSQIEPKSSP